MVKVPSTTKFVRTKGYYVRQRLPNGKLGSRHIINWERAHGRKVPKGYCINHIDGNKCNDHPSNLEAVTFANNIWLNHNHFDNKQTRAARRKGTLLGPGVRVRK